MFVEITAEQIASKFAAAGFTRSVRRSEVTYERAHSNPKFRIVVYTSLTNGETVTRSKGSDAIRAALVMDHNGKTRGVTKTTRVNRTGTPDGVLERTIQRARDLWAEASKMTARGACPHCGAPRYADSGRCTAFCGH